MAAAALGGVSTLFSETYDHVLRKAAELADRERASLSMLTR